MHAKGDAEARNQWYNAWHGSAAQRAMELEN